MFTASYREEVREKMLSQAKKDHRIVSAAVIGSYAQGTVDRWSDIDLTFGVDESFAIAGLLDSWTDYMTQELSASLLFDVKYGGTVYRVFILPGCLQVDLSFSPAKEFGPIGPHFKLLYGKQNDKRWNQTSPSTKEIFGYLVHHLLHARIGAERNKLWQAEFWLNEAKNHALKLACISHGLQSDYGRGLDELPEEVLTAFENAMVTKRNKDEIRRVIKVIVEGLKDISNEINQATLNFSATLNELTQDNL
ncbi:MAG: nucleotidyltransferase domain-containing protein [Saprospiraceae bacterium]|nr:nucleotidyltransferase domain-containing protein [Saprospiraceae bacterium]